MILSLHSTHFGEVILNAVPISTVGLMSRTFQFKRFYISAR